MSTPTTARSAAADVFATTLSARIESEPAPQRGPSAPPAPEKRYETGTTLGEGGMGRVLEATDALFGRRVALKEMRDAEPTVDAARRFVVEALVSGNLEHPGVVPVYDRGVRAGRPFYTMRRLDGRTLGDAIAAAGDARARLALLPALVKVAHTLAFAHERGVVHRDLKPANVILGRHGEVTVIDWGIARVGGLRDIVDSTSGANDDDQAPTKTAAGAVLGTPSYMSPEQAAGRIDDVDARSDVFAIGAMLYEVLSGKAPYGGTTAMATLTAALEGRRAPLARVAGHAPETLRAICDRAMAQEPAERFPTAQELATALEEFSAGALAHREPAAVSWLIGILAFSFLALLVYALIGTFRTTSSAFEQGPAGLATAFLAIDGCLLALIEWWTRGRYRLFPFGVALALATLMGGMSATASGIGRSFDGVTQVTDAALFRTSLAMGIYESIGLLAVACLYTAMQGFFWALASRASSARRDAERAAR